MQNPVIFQENTEKYGDPEVFDRLYRQMDRSRQAKIDRLAREPDKRLSLGAGVLLQQALGRLGVPPPADGWELTAGEYGKPEYPALRDRFRFNLSHSGNRVLCVANYGPEEVGCDIELLRVPDLRVADRYFCPEEAAYIRSFPDPASQAEAFYRLWTLKESFVKTTGLGLRLPLREFEITIGDRITVKQQLTPHTYEFHSELSGGYALAWCVEHRQVRSFPPL